MCKTFYLMGTTCVGKDYFIDNAKDKYPSLFGSVNVGKEFRKRYPPEYFEGRGALMKTEDEAFAIFKEQHDEQVRLKKRFILVSGQPRLPTQVDRIYSYAPGTIVWLFAPNETLEERLAIRFENDPSGYDLGKQRLVNDRLQLYEVLFELHEREIPIKTIDVMHTNVLQVIDQIAHFGEF